MAADFTMFGKADFTMFGKEVHHPALKVVVAVVVIGVLAIALIMSPLLVPTHFLLRKYGRNGFYFDKRLVFNTGSFARR